MSDEIKIGDAVTLQHGGQQMTVEDVASGICSCVWHDGQGLYQSCEFLAECLRKISTDNRVADLVEELRDLSSAQYGYMAANNQSVEKLNMGGGITISIARPTIA